MPGSPEICLKPTRLTLNTRQLKKSTPKENCGLWYGIYRYIVQKRIQNSQFVIFKPSSYYFEETIGFDANTSFACEKKPSWYNKRILIKGYSVPRESQTVDRAFLEKQLMSISCYLTIFTDRLHFGCLTEFLIRLWSLCDIYFMLW